MTIDFPSESPKEIPFAEFVALRKRIVADGFKTLSDDEHTDLIRRTKRKEKRASELLLLLHNGFLELVFSRLKLKRRGFIDIEESMQEGRIVLLSAVDSFDPKLGKFSTYLHFALRTSMRRRNSGDPIIRIDPRLFGNGKLHEASAAACRNVVNLEDPIGDADELTFDDVIASKEVDVETSLIEAEALWRLKDFIRHEMHQLSARDRTIIEMRWFGDELRTLEEVGQHFDLSRERIRQIEAEIFDQIRKRIGTFRSRPSSSACDTIPNLKPVPT